MDSDDDNYEYEYSDAEEEQEYMDGDDGEDEMDWNPSQQDENPNAAPMMRDVPSIRMLPCDELVPVMKNRIRDATEVLEVPASAAAVLLREFNWSKERLLERFYEDPDKLQRKVGVYFRCHPVVKKVPKRLTRANSKSVAASCEICYESDGIKMLSMPCGHEFCTECWSDFVGNALEEGPSCVRKTCPQAKCTEVVTEEEAGKLEPSTLLTKFEQYQLRSFVESNSLTRWCPGRGCERVACAASASAMESEGSKAACDACSTDFCVVCGEEPHAPTVCKELAKWLEKCRNESETANWILANTKPCPKCSSRIEKNQGCNHMTCQRCRYEFCWICMGDWTEHGANTGGYYKCNKFDPNDDGDQSDAAKAKRELDRYLHYYKRYHAHSEAQRFAKKQLKETEARMVLLQESSENARWSDVEFLKTANEQLVECRRVLKYTYAYAYYFPVAKKLQKERFEHHQEMLERFTEDLSELSEKPLAEMNRTGVVNQTRVVKQFMKNILKYADDGMDDV
uniref:RBR-type E3 ubiquitin transferase n=1 Tax=Grammatophora oceanica TaxID=210454 RepID=A0A7S1YGL0_9STRA|mmetsp:Transcript_49717/g.74109  ORF Transcript_49717/g.74109 Transcript_49717/m.74109 type:complete len:511 (+) Transcript_49717:265-1797(+)